MQHKTSLEVDAKVNLRCASFAVVYRLRAEHVVLWISVKPIKNIDFLPFLRHPLRALAVFL